MCADTVTPLYQPAQIKRSYDFGGEKAVFTLEEAEAIRAPAKGPMLELLGFKPPSTLKFQMNTKHASFIYPDEKEMIGSSAVFANLLESMIRKFPPFSYSLLICRHGQDCNL